MRKTLKTRRRAASAFLACLSCLILANVGCDKNNLASNKSQPTRQNEDGDLGPSDSNAPGYNAAQLANDKNSETNSKKGINSTSKEQVPEDGYTKAQLHKNFTLLMLAYEPDLRARQLMQYLREYLTDEQEELGLKLMLEHDHEYVALKASRMEILNAAVDGDDTAAQLRSLNIEIVELSLRLRILLRKELLTKEQEQQRNADVADQREREALDLKQRQAKKQNKLLKR